MRMGKGRVSGRTGEGEGSGSWRLKPWLSWRKADAVRLEKGRVRHDHKGSWGVDDRIIPSSRADRELLRLDARAA